MSQRANLKGLGCNPASLGTGEGGPPAALPNLLEGVEVFVKLDHAVLESTLISAYDKLVYSAVYSFNGWNNPDPWYSQIAARCQVSVRQVRKSVAKLSEVGLLCRDGKVYWFADPEQWGANPAYRAQCVAYCSSKSAYRATFIEDTKTQKKLTSSSSQARKERGKANATDGSNLRTEHPSDGSDSRKISQAGGSPVIENRESGKTSDGLGGQEPPFRLTVEQVAIAPNGTQAKAKAEPDPKATLHKECFSYAYESYRDTFGETPSWGDGSDGEALRTLIRRKPDMTLELFKERWDKFMVDPYYKNKKLRVFCSDFDAYAKAVEDLATDLESVRRRHAKKPLCPRTIEGGAVVCGCSMCDAELDLWMAKKHQTA